jgi:hypothetical protein
MAMIYTINPTYLSNRIWQLTTDEATSSALQVQLVVGIDLNIRHNNSIAMVSMMLLFHLPNQVCYNESFREEMMNR